MELSSVNTRLQFSPPLFGSPPKQGEQRPMPESFYGNLHTLHSNEVTPRDLDFKTVRGKPEKVTLTTPVTGPDGSEITEVYSFANALKQHYQSGTIERYQHDLQAQGQQAVQAVIRIDEQVVGTLMPDEKFRWFSADVRTIAVTEGDSVAASYGALTEHYGKRLTITDGITAESEQPASYAQVYEAATATGYQEFVDHQVTKYRMAAEKFLAG